MRVFPNNDGSELIFTVYRRPNVSDQEFEEDAKSVEKDLAKLGVRVTPGKGNHSTIGQDTPHCCS